jgi:hypothetical protein
VSRTFDETIPLIKLWFDSGQAGMMLIHKGPERREHPTAEQWTECYVMRSDVDEVTAKAADWLIAKTGAFKIEIGTNEGKMTKLKLTRRI